MPLSYMDRELQRKSEGWFLPLRLATYIILAVVVVLYMGYPGYLHLQFVLYSLFTLGFAVSYALSRRIRLNAVTETLTALQFLFEISIESGIIYATGNVQSSFSALFLLTIVSAALTYRLVGTLVMASLVSLAYSFIIWLGLGSKGNPTLTVDALRTIFHAEESVFYSIFLHILIFYLVAFISGYLAERLRSQNIKLVDASMALRRARLETDDILRHLNSGLLTIDATGCIIYFNRAAERILGYREEEVKGMQCGEVFAERMPELSESLLRCLQGTIDRPRRELTIINGEAKEIPLGLSTSVLTDEGREVRGVIAIFSDLTDAKALEAKVRAGDRLAAVGEMSASIAHEIRNPLAAISGSVEVLKHELSLDGENARLMELIIKESLRLNKILSEFLSYARIDRPAYNKVELCHVVSDVIEMVRHHHAMGDNVQMGLESDESFVYVVGDEDLIKQLLMNLALNACEAFEGGAGSITFHLVEGAGTGTIELRLVDDGPGVAPENLEKIFQPFFSTKKQGTGLGLAIVHRICSTLKLNLAVHSQPGSGTMFVVEFRRYSLEQAHGLESPPTSERFAGTSA